MENRNTNREENRENGLQPSFGITADHVGAARRVRLVRNRLLNTKHNQRCITKKRTQTQNTTHLDDVSGGSDFAADVAAARWAEGGHDGLARADVRAAQQQPTQK